MEYINSLSVDCVIFGFDQGELKVLLIERAGDPGKGMWALPGGFVEPEEDLDQSAQRILEELTGLSKIYMEQFHTFGEVKRYPLGRVISVAYYALVKVEDYMLRAAANAKEARWHLVSQVPELVFDHNKILDYGLAQLRSRIRFRPLGFELLPEKFTLSQLQKLYEEIWNRPLDKRNFRKKILSMDLIIPLEEYQKNVAHRAARLYQFDINRYNELVSKGFIFEF